MFNISSSQAVQWNITVRVGVDSAIPYPEEHPWVEVVIQADFEQILLPVGKIIIPTPLIFSVYAEFIRKSPSAVESQPTDVSVGIQAVVLCK